MEQTVSSTRVGFYSKVSDQNLTPPITKIIYSNLKAAFITFSWPLGGRTSPQAENHIHLTNYGLIKLMWRTC